MTKPWDFYHGECMKRTIEEMKRNSMSGKVIFGSKNAPLLDVPIEKYVVDELHLMLRITDVLIRNLIDDAKSLDDESKVNGQKSQNVENLAKLFQKCGVSF